MTLGEEIRTINQWNRGDKIRLVLFLGLAAALIATPYVVFPAKYYLANATNDGGGKGLRVFLTVNTNLQPQNAKIETYQFDNWVQVNQAYLNGGTTQIELNYQKEAIQNNNEFGICVTAESSNLRSCGYGYDSSEKKPEYVTVDLYGDHGQQSFSEPSQSQAQSSSNNNENNNALSQSQETTIIICNDGKCKKQ
jgi:hypothetical protein